MKNSLIGRISLMAAAVFAVQALCAQNVPSTAPVVPEGAFPIAVQFTPVPSGEGWRHETPPLSDELVRATVDNMILHGVTHLAAGEFSHGGADARVYEYATALGMKIDYTSNGVQLFKRDQPSPVCFYTPDYIAAVRERIEPVLGSVKKLEKPATIFPYMDEPFHSDTTSFDYREPVKKEFRKRYGYAMPESYAAARRDPRKHLDFVNFQASTYTDAWRQIYREVKAYDDRPLVVMTHDSHNVLGGGVGSDSKYAVDDVFHWGGDFADMFMYDIYPYTYLDYRFGEYGKCPKPRISQMHFTLAQMRNLTVSYGKKLGFWLGMYNDGWFARYLTREMREQYWGERELAYTAIAGGADYIIAGINIPSDARHWEDFGEGMRIIGRAGAGLTASVRPKARAAFLFPRTQYVQLNEEYFNVALTFELCARAFGELDIIHEEQITDELMNGYDILVLADVKLLPEAVAENIEKFVRRGGTVIADCVPQTDELLRASDTMSDLFGVKSASTDRVLQLGTWNPQTMYKADWAFGYRNSEPPAPVKTFDEARGGAFGGEYDFRIVTPRDCLPAGGKTEFGMESGKPALITNRTGKGKTYLFGFCLQDSYFQTWWENDPASRSQLYDLVNRVFGDTGIRSHGYSSNPDMEIGVRLGGNEAFVFVINHEASDAITDVTLADLGFDVGRIVDLHYPRFAVDFTDTDGVVKFNIPAQEGSAHGITRLLRVTPKEQK